MYHVMGSYKYILAWPRPLSRYWTLASALKSSSCPFQVNSYPTLYRHHNCSDFFSYRRKLLLPYWFYEWKQYTMYFKYGAFFIQHGILRLVHAVVCTNSSFFSLIWSVPLYGYSTVSWSIVLSWNPKLFPGFSYYK